jgi:hypothetical protein
MRAGSKGLRQPVRRPLPPGPRSTHSCPRGFRYAMKGRKRGLQGGWRYRLLGLPVGWTVPCDAPHRVDESHKNRGRRPPKKPPAGSARRSMVRGGSVWAAPARCPCTSPRAQVLTAFAPKIEAARPDDRVALIDAMLTAVASACGSRRPRPANVPAGPPGVLAVPRADRGGGGRLAACDPGPSSESGQSARTWRKMRMSRRILSRARAKASRRGLRAQVSCRT